MHKTGFVICYVLQTLGFSEQMVFFIRFKITVFIKFNFSHVVWKLSVINQTDGNFIPIWITTPINKKKLMHKTVPMWVVDSAVSSPYTQFTPIRQDISVTKCGILSQTIASYGPFLSSKSSFWERWSQHTIQIMVSQSYILVIFVAR